jgi:hypothetical protein
MEKKDTEASRQMAAQNFAAMTETADVGLAAKYLEQNGWDETVRRPSSPF